MTDDDPSTTEHRYPHGLEPPAAELRREVRLRRLGHEPQSSWVMSMGTGRLLEPFRTDVGPTLASATIGPSRCSSQAHWDPKVGMLRAVMTWQLGGSEVGPILCFIAREPGPGTYANLMAHYYPAGHTSEFREIARPIAVD